MSGSQVFQLGNLFGLSQIILTVTQSLFYSLAAACLAVGLWKGNISSIVLWDNPFSATLRVWQWRSLS